METSSLARLTPFAVPETNALDVGARSGRNFAAERAEPGANVFEAVGAHVLALQAAGKRVAIALWSEGARLPAACNARTCAPTASNSAGPRARRVGGKNCDRGPAHRHGGSPSQVCEGISAGRHRFPVALSAPAREIQVRPLGRQRACRVACRPASARRGARQRECA